MTSPDLNKYEMIIASAREARRLNEVARLAGRELKIRPTTLAWNRLQEGKVNFTYEAEPFEEAEDLLAPPAEGEETPAAPASAAESAEDES